MIERNTPPPVGGWLFFLCVLLVIWHPLNLALVAASALQRVSMRGTPFALMLLLRIVVAAFGIAAGLALSGRRPGAVTMAKVSLVLSAAADVIVYTTPYFPNNRMPGDTKWYVAASLVYSGVWLAYLFRSTRVRRTFGSL